MRIKTKREFVKIVSTLKDAKLSILPDDEGGGRGCVGDGLLQATPCISGRDQHGRFVHFYCQGVKLTEREYQRGELEPYYRRKDALTKKMELWFSEATKERSTK